MSVSGSVVLIGVVVDDVGDPLCIYPNDDPPRERYLEIPRAACAVEPYDEERSRVVVDEETMEQPVWDAEEVAAKVRQLEELFDGAPFTVWNMIPETRLAAAIQMDLLEPTQGA